MLIIYAKGYPELIRCKQDVKAAWRHASHLAYVTGIPHHVGRI